MSVLSHLLGIHAPGYRDLRAAARAMHHVLFAHGTAIDALRAEGVKNLGIVTNLEKSEPPTDSDEDMQAADLGDALFNRWFLGGVYKGQYPEVLTTIARAVSCRPTGERDMEVVSRPLDWAGINYYTRGLYKYDPTRPAFPITQVKGTRPKQRSRLGDLPRGPHRPAGARLARIHQAAALRHRERHVRRRRRAPRRPSTTTI